MITKSDLETLKPGDKVWFCQARISGKGDRLVKVIKPTELAILAVSYTSNNSTGAVRLEGNVGIRKDGWITVDSLGKSWWGMCITLKPEDCIIWFNDTLDNAIKNLEKNLERAKNNFQKLKIKL